MRNLYHSHLIESKYWTHLIFLSESLEKLVDNLRNSGNKFSITNQIFQKYIQKDINVQTLILRKSIYPYEYMDSFEKFEEKSLPSIESFYSTLNSKVNFSRRL